MGSGGTRGNQRDEARAKNLKNQARERKRERERERVQRRSRMRTFAECNGSVERGSDAHNFRAQPKQTQNDKDGLTVAQRKER